MLDVAGPVNVSFVAYGAEERRVFGGGRRRPEEVRERNTAAENLPKVGVVLVHVLEKALLVGTNLLADLAGQVVGTREHQVLLWMLKAVYKGEYLHVVSITCDN